MSTNTAIIVVDVFINLSFEISATYSVIYNLNAKINTHQIKVSTTNAVA